FARPHENASDLAIVPGHRVCADCRRGSHRNVRRRAAYGPASAGDARTDTRAVSGHGILTSAGRGRGLFMSLPPAAALVEASIGTSPGRPATVSHLIRRIPDYNRSVAPVAQ